MYDLRGELERLEFHSKASKGALFQYASNIIPYIKKLNY